MAATAPYITFGGQVEGTGDHGLGSGDGGLLGSRSRPSGPGRTPRR